MAIDTETAFSFEFPNGDVRTALVIARYEDVSEIVVFLASGDPPMYDNSGEPTRMPHFVVVNTLTPPELFSTVQNTVKASDVVISKENSVAAGKKAAAERAKSSPLVLDNSGNLAQG